MKLIKIGNTFLPNEISNYHRYIFALEAPSVLSELNKANEIIYKSMKTSSFDLLKSISEPLKEFSKQYNYVSDVLTRHLSPLNGFSIDLFEKTTNLYKNVFDVLGPIYSLESNFNNLTLMIKSIKYAQFPWPNFCSTAPALTSERFIPPAVYNCEELNSPTLRKIPSRILEVKYTLIKLFNYLIEFVKSVNKYWSKYDKLLSRCLRLIELWRLIMSFL